MYGKVESKKMFEYICTFQFKLETVKSTYVIQVESKNMPGFKTHVGC